MKASITGRVSHTNLPKGKALLPLFEAVVNAYHAIEEAGVNSDFFPRYRARLYEMACG